MSVVPYESELAATGSEPLLSEPEARDRKLWMERIQEAKKARAPFEPGWLQSLAFAAGKQHLKWDREDRKLFLPELNEGEERSSADKIMQYRNTALGELTGDDDRPELQFRREDLPAEEFTKDANFAVEYGWDAEWRADTRLLETKRTLIDLGTAAVRVRFDSTVGPVKMSVPHKDGRPLLDSEEAHAHVAELAERGAVAEFRDIHEGRTTLDVLTPLHMLVPPSIPDSDRFPWEIVVWPELISRLEEEYGPKAAGLVEDTDIAGVFALSSNAMEDSSGRDVDAEQGKLKDHVWVYTCYERPCRKYPKGRVVVLASNTFRVLAVRDELPYKGPDESYRSGITYFHWWRVTGRFWGKGLVEALKDPQRSINRRVTQKNEIIDRGMPFALEEEGAILPRTGKPMETVKVAKGAAKPDFHAGMGAGEWMYRDLDALKADMEEAAGIRAVSLGDNPSSVTNFSQLSLLRDNDQIKLKPTIHDYRIGVAQIVENCVYDMGRYWGSEKRLALAGEDGIARAAVFNATKIPPFFLVKVAKGAPKPHSQSAEIRKIEDIARYAAETGAAATDPVAWTRWFADSLAAGKALPLPEPPQDDQRMKALYENHFLIEGHEPEVDYWDPALIHIPVCRALQDQARMAGDMELYERCERHILAHLQMEEQKAAEGAGQPPAQAAAV
jgi:hypothetical protein